MDCPEASIATEAAERFALCAVSTCKPAANTQQQYRPPVPLDNSSIEADILALCERTVPNCMLASHLRPPPAPPRVPILVDMAMEFQQTTVASGDFTQYLRQNIAADDIEYCAGLDQGTADWKQQRLGRITACPIYDTMHFTGTKLDGSLVRTIVDGSHLHQQGHRLWPPAPESVAWDMYLQKHQQDHPSASVETTGLHVHQGVPFLTASPDRMVSCDVCGPGILEIKCSHKYRSEHPLKVAALVTYYVRLDEYTNSIILKDTSLLYYQIQCQMGACKKSCCDFVHYTDCGIATCLIDLDALVWDDIIRQSSHFFAMYVLPKIC